jgi:galactokinase
LVKASEWADFEASVKAAYLVEIGYATDIYQASIDDGARKL